MTEIAFHFNAPDKLAYACRFARKVSRADARLAITGPQDQLDQLDRMLWAMASTDFVAHCRGDADEEMCKVSPVILVSDAGSAPHSEVLLNLGTGVPPAFSRFGKLIEVVSSQDEADRQAARERWRHYASRGYAIVRHDLVLKGG